MKIKIKTWDDRELTFANVTIEIIKGGYKLIQFGKSVYITDLGCSKIEVTFYDGKNSSEYDIEIKEW